MDKKIIDEMECLEKNYRRQKRRVKINRNKRYAERNKLKRSFKSQSERVNRKFSLINRNK